MTRPVTVRLHNDAVQNGDPDMTKVLCEDLRRFVADAHWTFAKTMPTWPHEYLVRGRVDPVLFEALVAHIRDCGYEGRFYGRTITYFEEGGLVYWTMGAPISETTIINRCKAADTFEARPKAGTLPPYATDRAH